MLPDCSPDCLLVKRCAEVVLLCSYLFVIYILQKTPEQENTVAYYLTGVQYNCEFE